MKKTRLTIRKKTKTVTISLLYKKTEKNRIIYLNLSMRKKTNHKKIIMTLSVSQKKFYKDTKKECLLVK